MTPVFLFALVLTGCAGSETANEAADEVRYSAAGENPSWRVTISENAIQLSMGAAPRAGQGSGGYAYRGVEALSVEGARRWNAGNGTAVIGVEAWRTPCTGAGGALFEDRVRVRLSGRELNGCGGRQLSPGSR
jgi:uncharacterized membrane protein